MEDLELFPETKADSAGSTSVGQNTIGREIRHRAELQPEHPAVVASGFAPLSYRELQRLIDEVRAGLRSAGFDRTARIVIAMRNGPQAAVAIVAVACAAIGVPLDPRQSLSEIEACLTALRPDAVLLVKGADSAARRVTERKGITIIEAIQSKEGILGLSIAPPKKGTVSAPDESGELDPDATAFILQTSGTTSVPKLIPRSHRNMLAAAAMFQTWFRLTAQDCCLSVSPVSHGQGLVVTVFTPLLTGGAVAFPANPSKFDYSEWFGTLKSTWYTGSPTLHRMILDQTKNKADAKIRHSLRFILSGGAPLPADIREGLEHTLGLPVLDHYGFSEAAQLATNVPPPGPSKFGTCGIPWPDTIIIIGEDGRQLPPKEQGEVLARGPTVMPGYLNAPELNRTRFVNGWFKTGDIGSLDEDGFLTLHGRKDELINSGGDKISPAEIDDALMRHPAVADAAAFAVPHPRLGEVVAAAVVLRPGMTATPDELREYLQERVASFKVPRRIVLCDQLPRGQTDKVMRRRLAECLEEMTAAENRTPRSIEDTAVDSNLVIQLTEIWERLLKIAPLSLDDDFFENGGDSLLAMEMLVELERLTGRTISSAILFEAATIGQLAQKFSESDYLDQKPTPLIRLNANGSQPPLVFFVHAQPDYSEIMLARLLGSDRPLFLVVPHGLGDEPVPPTIEAIAADRLSLILDAQPEGPYRLFGYCFQGIVAFEVARLLVAAKKEVELVIMVDTPNINANGFLRLLFSTIRRAQPLAGHIVEHATARAWHQCARLRQFLNLPLAKRWAAIKRKIRNLSAGDVGQPTDEWLAKHAALLPNYFPKPLAVRVVYFSADYDAKDWRQLCPGLEIIKTPGGHTDIELSHIAEYLRPRL